MKGLLQRNTFVNSNSEVPMLTHRMLIDLSKIKVAEQPLCEDCHMHNSWRGDDEIRPGTYRLDPFDLEINEREVERCLCDYCYHERKQDI